MEQVLRLASFARTNDFDLLSDEGWALLRKEVCQDFPTLALQDLSSIIKKGIKGKITTPYSSTALNFTKVYQWIETELASRKSEFAIPQHPDAYQLEVKPEYAQEQERKRKEHQDRLTAERVAKWKAEEAAKQQTA